MKDLGVSLVKTHDYQKAQDYYIDSLSKLEGNISSSNIYYFYDIASDFISLLMKLAKSDISTYPQIKENISEYIEKIETVNTKDDCMLKKKLSRLRFMKSQVQKEIYKSDQSDDYEEITTDLEIALNISKEVYNRLRELKNEKQINEEKEFLSLVCFEIGKFYDIIQVNLEFSEKFYLQAIKYDEKNEK